MQKVRLINITQNRDVSDFVDSIDIVMPSTTEISSMVAKFTLEEKLINTGDELKIDVLDDIGNIMYSLNGEAKLSIETLNYTNLHNYNYEVKDSYSKLFEKNIVETQVFYDLYLCNNADVNNSLMHIIAKNLGFKNLDFHNAIYENGQYIRVPFVIFRENEKWIDELQSLIAATNSVLYITAGKLFFKVNNFILNGNVIFDKTNIITRISKSYKATENNGVKVLYDRYKKLENQVVFNLKSKITVEKNTNKDTEVKSMRINYITSSVANPVITKATGYYFRTHGDVNSKVDVDLIRDTHYVLEEFTETQAIVKFYNPLNYDLIIDNFEIKGIPLVMYTDNSTIVKKKIVVEKNQENFNIVNKNKYIQTPELATNIAKQIYRSNISSQFSYNLDTIFINNLQLGDVYNLAFENIDVIGRLISYTIQLRPSDFRLSLKLDEIGSLDNVALSYTDSLNSNVQYVDLTNVEKKIEENKQELKTVQANIRSKLHKMETTPTENVAENDIWLNPKTNVWKKYYNGVWNNISDDEILPSMKMYNSVDTNIIKLQGTTDKVGAYLLNDGEKMGSLNGELAHTTFDKLGQFEAVNPNNKVALNIKDPANPSRVNSQILLGVTDVNDPKWEDVIFAIGDEASPSRLLFRNGTFNHYIGGKEINEKFSEEQERAKLLSLMSTGKMLYTDPEFKNGLNSIVVYNNARPNNVVTITREQRTKNDHLYPPNSTGYTLNIKNAGTINANTVKPGAGGFYFGTMSRKEAVFITRFIAKIPVGWKVVFASNNTGGSRITKWLTPEHGTGNYEEYIFYLKCGNSTNENDFSTTNFFYLTHTSNNYHAFTWYLAYATVFDCTANRDEKIYEIDGKVDKNKTDVDKNISNLSKGISDSLNTAKGYADTKKTEAINTSKSYTDNMKAEINRQLTNADGRLTQLQQNYQNTVQDVTNFKTQTANRIDTVQGALDNGNFVVNGNTTFADGVRFVSRGTNEVITIANGSIDFHRDGQKLTRIKNSRYGTIATDSAGKGVVNFPGFKQPMIVLTSIKSANFGKNMASVFCYAEHITGTQYRMFVGGTNEHYTEAKPIKVVGTEWSTLNAFKTTLLEMTCNFKESGGNYTLQNFSDSYEQYKDFSKRTSKVLKVPKFNVKIVRVDGTAETILYAKDYTVSYYFKGRHDHNGWRGYRESYYKIEPINLTKTFNLLKTYTVRTNVKFKLVITILEPNFTIERYFAYSHTSGGADDKSTSYDSAKYVGTLRTITPADFTGLSITASSETSTLSGVTGTGEVQYIAMEID
ncbi:MAG: hypothetical protein SOY04_17875 [Clostridium celatum]|nr:hypothetical protein [Clostridium celatum]